MGAWLLHASRWPPLLKHHPFHVQSPCRSRPRHYASSGKPLVLRLVLPFLHSPRQFDVVPRPVSDAAVAVRVTVGTQLVVPPRPLRVVVGAHTVLPRAKDVLHARATATTATATANTAAAATTATAVATTAALAAGGAAPAAAAAAITAVCGRRQLREAGPLVLQ